MSPLSPKVVGGGTHHVTVPIKGLDACKKLLVVSEGDQDLCVVSDGLLQHRQWSLADLMLLQLPQLCLIELGLRYMNVLTVSILI